MGLAVADVIAFLASDGARWITGASIPVNGGRSFSRIHSRSAATNDNPGPTDVLILRLQNDGGAYIPVFLKVS